MEFRQAAEAETLARDALAMMRKLGVDDQDASVKLARDVLCEALSRQKKFAEAEGIARERVASHPLHDRAWVALGNILIARGKTSEAESAYQRALQLARQDLATGKPDADDSFPGYTGFMRVAIAFQTRGRFAEAEALYREVLPIAQQRLGTNLDVAGLHVHLAEVLRAQGKLAEAEAAYRKALPISRANSGMHDPTGKLVELLETQGKFGEVESLYREAIQTHRNAKGETADLALTITQFGMWLESHEKPAQAEAQFRAALAIRRKLHGEEAVEVSWSLSRLAEVLKAQGKTADVEALWRERLQYWQAKLATADTVERRVEVHLRLFWSLLNTGQVEQAKQACREVLGLNPTEAAVPVLNEHAWTLATSPELAHRDAALAVALAQKAAELIPQDGAIRNTLGVARYRRGEYQQAIAELEKSIELRQGGDSFDFFFLAMAHQRLGNPQKARQQYDKAVEWMRQQAPQNEELIRFCNEAEETLLLKRTAPATTIPIPTTQGSRS